MADGDIVVVTGGAGFLGQHIVKMLQEKTSVSQIRVFDQRPFSKKLDYKDRVAVRSFTGDINDPEAVNVAFAGATAVIHTVGIVSVQVFPDHKYMEHVNVGGTKTVVQSCIDHNVQRLIYTSTIDTVIGFDAIENGNENISYPEKHLYDAYGGTKAKAEQVVKKANGSQLQDGSGSLCTLSLRPPVMYGELDMLYIPTSIRAARKTCGVVPRIGDGKAKIQQAYVGNIAWCHVLACQKLKESSKLGGQNYFAVDDTPVINTMDFVEPFLKAKGCKVSNFKIPYTLVYTLFWLFEMFLFILSPLYIINPEISLRTMVYANTSLYFNGKKAREALGYKPLYSWEESKSASMKFYDSIDV